MAVTGLVVTGPSATAADPAGTVVLPPVYGDTVPRTDIVGSVDGGIGFTVSRRTSQDPSFQYWTAARGAVDSGISATTVSMAGHQAAVMTYGRNGGTKVHLVDTVTGLVREVPLGPSQGDTFVATGDGFLIHVSTPDGVGYDQLRLMNGAVPFTANFPVAGYVQAPDARADSRGVLLEWIEFDGGNGHVKLSYLDFATRRWTKLADVREIGTIAMSATHIAWLTGGDRIHRVPRSSLGSTPYVYDTPTPVSVLALNGTSMAWESDSVGGSQDRITRIWTKESGKAPVKLSVQAAWPTPLGSDFAVSSGTTLTNAGLYRLRTGATSLGARLVSSGPDAPLSVTQSAGRFLYQSPTKRTAVSQRLVRASTGTATPKLTVAAATTLAPTSVVGVTPVASGGHTATYECASSPCEVVVRDAGTVIRRIALSDSVVSLGLSGNNLLVAATHESAGAQTYYSLLYDLNTSAAPVRLPYTDAVSGERIAFVQPDSSVVVRDLSGPAPVDTLVRPPVMPVGTTQVRPVLCEVRLVGDWVLWSIPDDQLDAAETVAVHLPDGASVPFPAVSEIRLVDGEAAYIAPGDRSVHVVDLATRTDTVVGRAQLETSNRQWLALSHEVVAFVAANDTTHLVPLAGVHAVGAAPRAEGTVRSSASSVVRPLRVQADASRPLSAWRFVVSNASGRAVYTSTGSAPDGGARPVWPGRTTAGARVPDGIYTWRITGSGPGGALAESAGTRGAMSGTVRLDTVAPRASLSVPRRTARSGAEIRWRASEASRFTVTVSKRVRKHGRWTWSKPRTWQRTTAPGARYAGAHVPYRLKPGVTLRFALTAVDAAGNPSTLVRRRATAR